MITSGMKRIILLIVCLSAFASFAQTNTQTKVVTTKTVELTQPFGKIDREDLEMKRCDFEPDANAEVLFDSGLFSFDGLIQVYERHVRMKIFNDKGRNQASVKLEYIDKNGAQYLTNLKAETINLNNGNVEYIPVDKKSIYKKSVDKYRSELAFTFPNVQAGSIIEFSFHLESRVSLDFPVWYFQTNIPTRYSEIKTSFPDILQFESLELNSKNYFINQPDKKAMINIPSISSEPFMTARTDNQQKIMYKFTSVNASGIHKTFTGSWENVAKLKLNDKDFGWQLERSIDGEREFIKKAKSIISIPDRVEYLFNLVKNSMKWDDIDVTYTFNGTNETWKDKSGNSTEINLILCRLLNDADVKAYPMLVSTRQNGKVIPGYPNLMLFNSTVVYVPLERDFYVLDASNKYNVYNELPENLLNNMAFYMNTDDNKYDLLFLQKLLPVNQNININSTINPDGTLNGSARVSAFSYDRLKTIEQYKTDGEKKYLEHLTGKNNNLAISDLKFDNMDVDTLPLILHFDFKLQPENQDNNYLYINCNFLPEFKTNPFIKDSRTTNIDFGYCSNYLISNTYKLPAGYKIDALPKSTTMAMPDGSITFKRLVSDEDGTIAVRYFIVHKKSVYFKEDYAALHDFYKKMYEMLNEQIVLKKG